MIILLMIAGAFFGSFACAQVWRLRARQLVEDEVMGEKVSKRELTRLKGLIRPVHADRSECLHCHHVLAWYDLIPVFSWVSLGGRCRYCHKPIGYTEVLAEVGLGVVFACSVLFWPFSIGTLYGLVMLALWLVACTLMTILFIYDARWYLLPFSINLGLIALGVVYALIRFAHEGWALEPIVSLLVGLVILAGLYYLFSLAGWVGMGDSILGVGLALFVGTWQLSFLTLFLANLIGCFVLVPIALRGKLHRSMHVPFGPFLILGAFIAVLWGDLLIQMFFRWMNTPFL